MTRRPDDPVRLTVDPVACEAVGLCAFLARDLIELDRWGYPVVPDTDLDHREVRSARRAARGCPRRALRLETTSADARP